MPSTEIIRQLRLLLTNSPQAPSLPDVLALVDEFVHRCASSSEPEVLLFNLEDELQAVHRDVIHHERVEQTDVFLSVLLRLLPVLSPVSLISTWFELVLRPALRQPKLLATAVSQAKDLVLAALKQRDENYAEKQGEFRRRILDLYLLDAFNEGSGEDMLEWAGLPGEQRESRDLWKANLEDILVKFGMDQTEALLTQVFHCFASPSSRLQLLNLLDRFTSHSSFGDSQAGVFASHPIMQSILTSLLVDNSTTVITIAHTIVSKLLCVFAVKECAHLKRMLPQLFAIFARMICWQERQFIQNNSHEMDGEQSDSGSTSAEEEHVVLHAVQGSRATDVRPDIEWERLDMSFHSKAAPAPSPKRYFSILYYLFPCNLLSFLRRPAEYLKDKGEESPYVVDWDEALDVEQIKTKSEILLREHVAHPLIIWRTADSELTEPEFFASYDIDRVVSESMLLQNQNSRLIFANHEREQRVTKSSPEPELPLLPASPTPIVPDGPSWDSPQMVMTPSIAQTDFRTSLPLKARISVQDMINTSVTLKAGLDFEIVDSSPIWPYNLFSSDPVSSATSIYAESRKTSPERTSDVPAHVMEAMAGLQREILLLRNELNFELWLKRENVKQIGRLYMTQIQSRNAEAERQALHNKLREYKAQVASLQRRFKEREKQTTLTKKKNQDWIDEQQRKIHDLRDQKKTWTSETAALRLAEKEVRAHFAAQGKLLADAEKRVFELETCKKENAHKVDRLRDYERRIEQLTTLQKLWDADVEKYKAQAEVMRAMLSKYKKMELRLEAFESTHAKMDDQARASRRQIQALEAQLAYEKQTRRPTRRKSDAYPTYAAEARSLREGHKILREENEELKDEVEEMKAMVELLRAQVSGRTRGVVSSPSRSPILSSALHLEGR